jgi:hypothetical protein
VIPNPDLLTSSVTSWDAAIDATRDLYEEMLDAPHLSERDNRVRELVGLPSQLDAGRVTTPTPLGDAQSAAGETSWWSTRRRAAHRVSGQPRWP